jgi:hypothetical protein
MDDPGAHATRRLTLAAPRREAMGRRWCLTEVARQSSGLPPLSLSDYVDAA